MSKQKNNSYVIDILHIFIFCSFTFAQPLYDLLAQYGGFFVARGSKPLDIFTLVLFLSVLIPAFFSLVTLAFGLVNKKLKNVFYYTVISLLIALFCLPIMKKMEPLPVSFSITLSLLVGIVFVFFYSRKNSIKGFVTILAPAILIFPIYFLFFTPVNKLAFPKELKINYAQELETKTPIVFVMFDAFTLVSLLDEENKIDPIRYPNFSAFSKEAHWFRNYTAHYPHTHASVISVLTGNYITGKPLASAAEHPNSLFTLLGNSYDLSVIEETKLCPDEINKIDLSSVSYKYQMTSAVMDLSLVYLHILIPSELAERLPSITDNWGNFVRLSGNEESAKEEGNEESAKEEEKDKDKGFASLTRPRLLMFYDFIKSIKENNEKPTFHFFHMIAPHVPYDYLPSGRRYTPDTLPGRRKGSGVWLENEWLAKQGYQRYLLQVGAIDTAIGKLVEHLKDIDMYDKSLIILTADHGTLFKAGVHSRRFAIDYYESDIMPVPLLMKLPHQKEGVINDENVEGVDVLPTITDVLDIDLPWEVSGRSVFDDSSLQRPNKSFHFLSGSSPGKNRSYTYDSNNIPNYKKSLEWKLSMFGSGRTKPDGLFTFGPHSELVGKQIDTLGNIEKTDIMIRSNQDIFNQEINLSDDAFNTGKDNSLPAYLSGVVIDDKTRSTDEMFDLAVSVNGVIQTTTRSYRDPDRDTTNFYAIVPEDSFKPKDNIVAFYIIREEGDGTIKLLESADEHTYINEIPNIIFYGSKKISVAPGFIEGYVDKVDIDKENVTLSGWAVKLKGAAKDERFVHDVVMFVDDKALVSMTLESGTDYIERYKYKELRGVDFSFSFPRGLIKEDSNVAIAAILGDKASPLEFDKAVIDALATHPDLKNIVKQTRLIKFTPEQRKILIEERKVNAEKQAKGSEVFNSIFESIKKKQKEKNKGKK